MKLIGMLDSPYVRRVAVSLRALALPFEHRPLSVFRNFDEFSSLNPVVKAPTLITDEGVTLMDSTLILEYLEGLAGRSLLPGDRRERIAALRTVGLALAACEKSVQIVYENLRPAEKRHQPWVDRVRGQLGAAYRALEADLKSAPKPLDPLSQAGIATAVAWRFTQHELPEAADPSAYPALAAFSAKAEALPEYVAAPLE